MTRRCLVASMAAFVLRADATQEIWDLITSVASALGEGNAARCVAAFDPSLAGFQALKTNIQGLVQGFDVQASIDLVERTEDANGQSLMLDWMLHMTQRDSAARGTRRRETVKCRVEKRGRHWRIVTFDPLGLFAPPRL